MCKMTHTQSSHIISILLGHLNQLQKPQPPLAPAGPITSTKSLLHEESTIQPYLWSGTIRMNNDIIWRTATQKSVKIFTLELCAVYRSKVNWINLFGWSQMSMLLGSNKKTSKLSLALTRSTIFLTCCFVIACDLLAPPSTTSVFRLAF